MLPCEDPLSSLLNKICLRFFFIENSDFQLVTTSILVTPTTPAIVQITLLRDNVALEPNETVRLRFMQTVNTEVGEFLLNTIDVTIRDTDSKFCNIYTAMTVMHIFGHTYCTVKVLCSALYTNHLSVI